MIYLKNITKTYRTRHGDILALDSVDLKIEEGQFTVVRGPSGSGKTTLLMAIAGMQRPTIGSVVVGEDDLYKISGRARAKFRAANIGFVFQMFHLVPYLNVLENIALAGPVLGNKSVKDKAAELLEQLGLAQRAFHRPSQLSAGEKQRIAVARALLNRPRLILADEPTGNLDPENAAVILDHLSNFHVQGGTVIFVTHGQTADRYADRIINLRNGRIE